MAKPTKHRNKWRIRWTDHAGKRRSEVHERYKDAEQALRRHQLEVAEIKQGHRAPIEQGHTHRDLFEYWLEARAPLKRSGRDDRSIIERHLGPAFGQLPMGALNVANVDAYVASRQHLSPKTVNNHLTLLTTMLNLGVELGWLARAPKIKKVRAPVCGPDYRYLRTQSEIAQFLNAAQAEDEPVYVLYATTLYTGMRAGEVAGLHWDDVDLDRRLITVCRSYDGPTKSGRVRHVPILDPLLPVLRAWRLRHPGTLIFTNRDGRMIRPSSRVFQEVLHRVLDRAQFESPLIDGKRRWHITFHGLRHTFASHWVMNGGDLFKLQRILGHASIEMTMRYAHLAPHAFVADYGRFDNGAPSSPWSHEEGSPETDRRSASGVIKPNLCILRSTQERGFRALREEIE